MKKEFLKKRNVKKADENDNIKKQNETKSEY